MYRVNLVLGLRKAGSKSKGKLLSTVFGSIAILETVDKKTTEVVGADNVASLFDTGTMNTQLDAGSSKFFNELTIPQVFEELRKSYNDAPVFSDADVQITIGTKEHDLIDDFIPREVYRRVSDHQLIKLYMNKINNNDQLRAILR